MMIRPFALALLLLTTLTVSAQNTKLVKFKDFVFTNVTETKDLSYDDAGNKRNKAHWFDLYTPANDQSTERPLIIWMHGGGFQFGSKEAKGVQLWSREFAKRGYVAVSLNYSKSKGFPVFNFDELMRSAYYAVQDAHMAVAYFTKNAQQFGINPNKIILAGNSAGGMIALHTAYVSNAELAKFVNLPGNVTGANETTIPKIAGVVNFWGGIFNLDWLNNASVPIAMVHGNKDGTLTPTHKDAPLYGSIDIQQKASELQITNALKLYDGYAHELQKHFNPLFGVDGDTRKRWSEASAFAADFLYNQVLR